MASTSANPLPAPAPADDCIAVAMSGGVDSSAVAAMLKAEGHNVVGLTLQLWNQRRLQSSDAEPEAATGRCCSLDDVYDARRVAEQVGIPYYVVNQQQRFEDDVIRPFVAEYLAGRTPIPCTLCNNHLKFDQLLITARSIGADRIATGHYARNEFCPTRNRWILKRPTEESPGVPNPKDQTYFLFGLTQEQLSRTLFPLGSMTKPQVRARAAEYALALAAKPDSQEICFIPHGDYKRFLTDYLAEQGEPLPDTAGDLVTATGDLLGHHDGIHNFTVGQRKGLGPLMEHAPQNPLYVLQVDPITNRIIAGPEDELMSTTLRARDLNWISIPTLTAPLRVQIKVRHRHTPAWATIRPSGNPDEIIAEFDTPQRAITPGQAAVFYANPTHDESQPTDEVLGGGWIF